MPEPTDRYYVPYFLHLWEHATVDGLGLTADDGSLGYLAAYDTLEDALACVDGDERRVLVLSRAPQAVAE